MVHEPGQPEVPPAPVSPPLQRGAVPVRPSVWPTVIGIIAIIYATAMMLCNVSGLFAGAVYRWIADLAGTMGQPDRSLEITADVVADYQWLFAAYAVLAIVACVWLLLASVHLIKRRPGSRRSIIAWSIVELVLLLASIGLQMLLTSKVAAMLRTEGLAQRASEMAIESVINGVIMFVISGALPVFLLIWFTRNSIRSEMKAWTHRPTSRDSARA